mmetsp:Transcript_54697/g.133737  ORF Transcript_54697/g.133737 Transcript_54697/m.133737 type:complete len:261 (-) Transcript_54697:1074-1856(-)
MSLSYEAMRFFRTAFSPSSATLACLNLSLCCATASARLSEVTCWSVDGFSSSVARFSDPKPLGPSPPLACRSSSSSCFTSSACSPAFLIAARSFSCSSLFSAVRESMSLLASARRVSSCLFFCISISSSRCISAVSPSPSPSGSSPSSASLSSMLYSTACSTRSCRFSFWWSAAVGRAAICFLSASASSSRAFTWRACPSARSRWFARSFCSDCSSTSICTCTCFACASLFMSAVSRSAILAAAAGLEPAPSRSAASGVE